MAKKIYFNHTRVLIIEPELEQAIITTLENIPNIAQLLQEAQEIKPNTYVTKFMETTYTIIATKERIEKVTAEDIQRVTQKMFGSDPAYTLMGAIDRHMGYDELQKLLRCA